MPTVETILPDAQENFVTISTNALLIDAAKLLNGPERNLVVVCDEAGRIAGVVTKTDIVNRISQCAGLSCTKPVAAVMSRDVAFCHPEDPLHDVWSRIKRRGLKNMPVVNENSAPLGVLNAREALQALLEDAQHEEELLRDYVMCVGYH